MSFFRHGEIYHSDEGAIPADHAPAHRNDEFPAGYSLAGCAPAEPTSLIEQFFQRIGLRLAPARHIRFAQRFSIGPFNTEEHIDAAIKATAEISFWSITRKRAPHANLSPAKTPSP